jgi:hypothetical protein
MKAELLTIGEHIMADELSPPGRCHVKSCRETLHNGDVVYVLLHLSTPWLAEDDENNEYVALIWHKDCDEGSLAAAGADVHL